MTRRKADSLYILLLGVMIFVAFGWNGSLGDFKGVYYGAKCLGEHLDPYNPEEVLKIQPAQGVDPNDPIQRQSVSLSVYLPTTFLLVYPITLLGWQLGHFLWTFLTAASVILAGLLAWNLSADRAPLLSGGLIGFMLANGFGLLFLGNTAGVVIGLCVIAIWCFIRERFPIAGVLCLAVSLVIKPHNAGLIWLFFVLAGGTYRKRALQTLLVCVLISIPAIVWISSVAPHWTQELRSNVALSSSATGRDNPGPSGSSAHRAGTIIDMQTVFSVFRDDPRFYNPAAYLCCGLFILAWTLITARARLMQNTIWLALAAIAPLSLLPMYHRTHDAKILLLSVPACAMLWAEGKQIRWFATAFTTAGIFFTGDFPLWALAWLTRNFQMRGDIFGKIQTIVLARPVPLVLLAMGTFYLWIYFDRTRNRAKPSELEPSS
jgi:hypothetical protein